MNKKLDQSGLDNVNAQLRSGPRRKVVNIGGNEFTSRMRPKVDGVIKAIADALALTQGPDLCGPRTE